MPLQVYTVSGGKNIPAWLSDKKKKALRKDEEYRRRIELLQDFEFPAGCQKMKITPDGQYIFASGYHPPQVPASLHAQSPAFERYETMLTPPRLHSPAPPPSWWFPLAAAHNRCAATTWPSCR